MSARPRAPRRGPGRPRKGGSVELLDILQALRREGGGQLSVPDVVAALQSRIPCSRRTAYRIIMRAEAEGAIALA